MRVTLVLGLGAFLALNGCVNDDDYDDTRARGELGKGTFVYGCTNSTDTACDGGQTSLPRAVAVGGRFDLRFSVNGGKQPVVISPVSDQVRRIGDAFEVRAPGQFALLAVNGNREVIDIKHMRAAPVDEIRVQRKTELPSANLTLNPNESTQLLALPYDDSGDKLGGALDYSWHSSNDDLVSIDSLSDLNRVRVRAGAASGEATLTVEVSGKRYDVRVQIDDGSGALDAGQRADADANADTGAKKGAADAQVGADARVADAEGGAL